MSDPAPTAAIDAALNAVGVVAEEHGVAFLELLGSVVVYCADVVEAFDLGSRDGDAQAQQLRVALAPAMSQTAGEVSRSMTLRLTEEHLEALALIGKADGVTWGEVVRRAIFSYAEIRLADDDFRTAIETVRAGVESGAQVTQPPGQVLEPLADLDGGRGQGVGEVLRDEPTRIVTSATTTPQHPADPDDGDAEAERPREALDESYRLHPDTRPNLAEIAIGLAIITRVEFSEAAILQAAHDALERTPDATPRDVLDLAERRARATPTDKERDRDAPR